MKSRSSPKAPPADVRRTRKRPRSSDGNVWRKVAQDFSHSFIPGFTHGLVRLGKNLGKSGKTGVIAALVGISSLFGAKSPAQTTLATTNPFPGLPGDRLDRIEQLQKRLGPPFRQRPSPTDLSLANLRLQEMQKKKSADDPVQEKVKAALQLLQERLTGLASTGVGLSARTLSDLAIQHLGDSTNFREVQVSQDQLFQLMEEVVKELPVGALVPGEFTEAIQQSFLGSGGDLSQLSSTPIGELGSLGGLVAKKLAMDLWKGSPTGFVGIAALLAGGVGWKAYSDGSAWLRSVGLSPDVAVDVPPFINGKYQERIQLSFSTQWQPKMQEPEVTVGFSGVMPFSSVGQVFLSGETHVGGKSLKKMGTISRDVSAGIMFSDPTWSLSGAFSYRGSKGSVEQSLEERISQSLQNKMDVSIQGQWTASPQWVLSGGAAYSLDQKTTQLSLQLHHRDQTVGDWKLSTHFSGKPHSPWSTSVSLDVQKQSLRGSFTGRFSPKKSPEYGVTVSYTPSSRVDVVLQVSKKLDAEMSGSVGVVIKLGK